MLGGSGEGRTQPGRDQNRRLIEMGPEGGVRGGEIVAVGTPEAVAKNKASYTGGYLGALLGLWP